MAKPRKCPGCTSTAYDAPGAYWHQRCLWAWNVWRQQTDGPHRVEAFRRHRDRLIAEEVPPAVPETPDPE